MLPFPINFIDSASDFERLLQEITQQAEKQTVRIALDTEFWREKTYWPEVCLIQMFWDKKVYFLDVLKLEWKAFRDILVHPRIMKVMHACDQDCEIFYHDLGITPVSFFDTQIAARLLGYQRQIGYGTLVEDLLKIPIDKRSQHTNWRRRPLTDAQLEYAALDVIYLLDVYDILLPRLCAEQLEESCAALGQKMIDHLILLQNPAHVWTKWDCPRYGVQQKEILKFLAESRERHAQSLNVPRSHVFKDEMLVNMILNPPKTVKKLTSFRGMGPYFPDKKEFVADVNAFLTTLFPTQ